MLKKGSSPRHYPAGRMTRRRRGVKRLVANFMKNWSEE